MTKYKKNKLVSLVLALFLAVTALVTTLILIFNKSNSVHAATVEGWDTSKSISVGLPVDIPETVKVTVNGEDAVVDNKYVVFPNGTVKVFGDYPLGMVGEYSMLFKGTHNGNAFTAEQKFTVSNDSYMFSNPKSSVTYTKLDDLASQDVNEMIYTYKLDEDGKDEEGAEYGYEFDGYEYSYTYYTENGNFVMEKIYETDANGEPIKNEKNEPIVKYERKKLQKRERVVEKVEMLSQGNKKELLEKQGVNDGVISASLEANDTLKIGKVVNVYDLADENGNVDICSFIPGNYTPVSEGNKVNNNIDTHFSLVKIVDAHEPSNYVEFYIWSGTNSTAMSGAFNYKNYYVGAGAGNQVMKGLSKTDAEYLEENPDLCSYVDNDIYRVYSAERYVTSLVHGTHIAQNKNGDKISDYQSSGILYRSGLYTDGLMHLSFNVEKNRCYVNNLFVNDLDDSGIYPNKQERFKGFTTGEVYIQFEHAYSNSYAIDFEIASIFNMSGEQLVNSKVVDDVKPIIKIDVEKTTDTAIIIRNGKEFTIPSAQVIDVNKAKGYEVALYYNYSTDSQVAVSITNGKFTPNKAGVYTAVYSATDAYGNVSDETILEIISSDKDVITCDGTKLGALEAGKLNSIPSQNPKTLNKYVNEKVAVVYPDGTRVELPRAKMGNGYEFIPEYVGTCKLEYVFTDNIDTSVFSYDIASSGEAVFFKDSLAIPTYMIKDACYDIDNYFVYAPSVTGANSVLAEICYSVDGGEKIKIDNQHKFIVPAGTNIDFWAKYGEQYSSVYSSKIVDLAFSTNNKDYKNYWQGYKNVELRSNAFDYTMDANSTLSFVTPIAIGAFNLNYKIEDSANVNAYSLKINGVTNKEEGLIITYARIANKEKEFTYTVSSLDGKVYYSGIIEGIFADAKNLKVTADYYITSSENVRVKIPEFKSRNVEFKFDFTGTTGEFKVSVSKVCNQAFSGYNMQAISEAKPQVVYKSIYKEYFKGDECRLPNFNVSSALYPTSLSDLEITITSADSGACVKDANGKEIKGLTIEYGKEYSFMIDAVTTYRTKFIYKGKEKNIDGTYSVKTKDNQKPTVSFDAYDSEKVEKVKVNTNYTFRRCNVADDVTPTAELYVAFSVYNYKGDLEYWGEANSFTFVKEGTYKILIFCQDVEGNYATDSYVVEVK